MALAPGVQKERQREKFDLWNDMRDGFAAETVCTHCQLPIFAIDPSRWQMTYSDKPRWYHFIDPAGHGFRPRGKNEPVYDLVRRCDVALRHRYEPEGELDPRYRRRKANASLLAAALAQLDGYTVAEP